MSSLLINYKTKMSKFSLMKQPSCMGFYSMKKVQYEMKSILLILVFSYKEFYKTKKKNSKFCQLFIALNFLLTIHCYTILNSLAATSTSYLLSIFHLTPVSNLLLSIIFII